MNNYKILKEKIFSIDVIHTGFDIDYPYGTCSVKVSSLNNLRVDFKTIYEYRFLKKSAYPSLKSGVFEILDSTALPTINEHRKKLRFEKGLINKKDFEELSDEDIERVIPVVEKLDVIRHFVIVDDSGRSIEALCKDIEIKDKFPLRDMSDWYFDLLKTT